MLLIDDPDKTLSSLWQANLIPLKKVYDFELMMNGGHIRGYRLTTGKR